MTAFEGLYLAGVLFSLVYGILFLWKYRKIKGNWLPLIFNVVMVSLFSWLGMFTLYQVKRQLKKEDKL